METAMKKTGFLLAALAALTLMGCAGRYYDDGYHHDGYYHRDYRDYRADRDYRNWRATDNDRYRDDRDRY